MELSAFGIEKAAVSSGKPPLNDICILVVDDLQAPKLAERLVEKVGCSLDARRCYGIQKFTASSARRLSSRRQPRSGNPLVALRQTSRTHNQNCTSAARRRAIRRQLSSQRIFSSDDKHALLTYADFIRPTSCRFERCRNSGSILARKSRVMEVEYSQSRPRLPRSRWRSYLRHCR